jgi:hypothetical protein
MNAVLPVKALGLRWHIKICDHRIIPSKMTIDGSEHFILTEASRTIGIVFNIF